MGVIYAVSHEQKSTWRQSLSDQLEQLFNMTVRLSQGEALRLCSNTSDINVIIELSRHESPLVRVRALKEICPCRVSNKTITIKSNLLHLHITSSKVLLLLHRKKRENVIYCSLGLALINSRSLTLPMFLTPGERGYSWVLGASGRNARWRRCCCSKTGVPHSLWWVTSSLGKWSGEGSAKVRAVSNFTRHGEEHFDVFEFW